jgi:hypothetical protein
MHVSGELAENSENRFEGGTSGAILRATVLSRKTHARGETASRSFRAREFDIYGVFHYHDTGEIL